MNRTVTFGRGSAYQGWTFAIDQQQPGGAVLVRVRSAERSINGAMVCAMVLRVNTPAWRAAVAALAAGVGAPMTDTLTAVLADLPEHAAAYEASALQRAHIGLIAAAGVHARRAWAAESPIYEAVAAGSGGALPRRNPRPHNAQGSTDDFYG